MNNTKKTVIVTVVVLVLLTAIGGMVAFALSELLGKEESTEILREEPITVTVASVEPEPEPEPEPPAVSENEPEDVSADDISDNEAVSENEPEPEPEPKPEPKPEPEPEPEPEPKEPERVIVDGYEDKKAPVFLYYKGSPKLNVGDTFDVHKFIGYADDVDRNLDLTVEGSVDTSTLGTYPLKITVTDDAGRSTTKNMEVTIINTGGGGGGGEGGDTGPKEQFSDFIANYKTADTMLGIDVSRWQGDIDFDKCKAAGCEFVYMRIGGFDEGEHYTDRYFLQNWQRAKAAGMKIGIYWHSEDSTKEQIQASVKYLAGVLNGEALDFPIAFDWEDYRNFERYGMNLYDLNNLLVYFEDEVEKYGYRACLYGSKNAQNTIWTGPKKYPVWLAHYTSATNYEGQYFMWQHSSTGRIDGISGDVDLDVYYPNK
ncbi:MAG: DUF5011 domain-containing protein [Lachnospiraceae bacterium]|nr:DUF5011 domain-containing protein [Lachnospiraceae bacterium]